MYIYVSLFIAIRCMVKSTVQNTHNLYCKLLVNILWILWSFEIIMEILTLNFCPMVDSILCFLQSIKILLMKPLNPWFHQGFLCSKFLAYMAVHACMNNTVITVNGNSKVSMYAIQTLHNYKVIFLHYETVNKLLKYHKQRPSGQLMFIKHFCII